jgi:hypothetical protein
MRILPALFLLALEAQAQSAVDVQQILTRLERLEAENRALAEEVRSLRQELRRNPPETGAAATPPVHEQLAVQEARVEEHAQVKVEASQRFPIRITGMALFNAFLNSRGAGGADNPTSAAQNPGPASGGATWRQSVVGLAYRGPETVWGGKVNGSLYMDFFAGSNTALNHLLRVRTATIQVDWKTRSLMAGQEKPLISVREPNSLSQVGVSPLTSSGNLWLWQPQARFEQRFQVSEQTLFRAQAGIYQTSETSVSVPAQFATTLERSRPALQGRFELSHRWGNGRRLEIAPGFHLSSTHVAGTSADSSVASFDWFASFLPRHEFSGMYYQGENVGNMGALRQGFTILGPRNVIPVRVRGGWAQWSWLPTTRLTFNFYGGQQDDRNSDLLPGGVGKNQSYAGNMMIRVAPNVILSLEALQVRTSYLGSGKRLNNHYDLALGYLF